MIGQFTIGGQTVWVDITRGTCIAIPLDFVGAQPSHFGATPARAEPMSAGTFIGDTHRDGSCNVPSITINPHCNGTHTESVAHIVNDPVPIHQTLPSGLVPAVAMSVPPIPAISTNESYRPSLADNDSVITALALKLALNGKPDSWLQAVIIRTLPNHSDKRHRHYGVDSIPPFFTIEAVDYLISLDIKHLLVDVPSVDRMHDDGLLTVHHRFWNVPEGTHSLSPGSRLDRTITEMIYVPDSVPDGLYLLDLQIPAFSTDVAPSRPWLYPVEFI